jgi:hypothetical protein
MGEIATAVIIINREQILINIQTRYNEIKQHRK